MSEPGDLVGGRYRLVGPLPGGDPAVLWQALDERLDRAVAVKELQPPPGLNPTEAELLRGRAVQVARAAAGLEHPSAVSVFDVVDQGGRIWLVMELVPSEPLSTLLRELGVLSPEETGRIGFQVASALAAAHRLGVVHGDVRPANVLIADDGTARISDLGISHDLQDSSPAVPGMVHGTPAFLAPEVARGEQPGYAADVYGLGATLYAAAEGAPPFGLDQHPTATLQKMATGHLMPPTSSARLAPLLLRMLADDPGERPSMDEAAALLGELDAQASQGVPAAVPVSNPSAGPAGLSAGPAHPSAAGTRRGRRILPATGLLAALVLVGLLVATVLPDLGRGLEPAAGVPGTDPAAGLYVSANFAVPFQLAAPTWVAPKPQVDKRELVTWQTADVSLRFLVPLEVYPPGGKGPTAPPQDYLSYLLAQSGEGARFTDRSPTTVDGRPATLVTATATRRLAGVIGCPEAGMAQKRCYGLRPERQLRIAVVELSGRTLLIWLRSDRERRFEEERRLFEWTLGTVQFR